MIKDDPVLLAQKRIETKLNDDVYEGYSRENGREPNQLDPNTPMLANIAYNLAVIAGTALSINETLIGIHREMVAARVTAENKEDKTKRTFIGQKPA